ncbi:MAG: S8/S53 family peptidase [Bacteroidales bacterium]
MRFLRLSLLFFSFLLTISSSGQTIKKDYKDGHLYIVLKKEYLDTASSPIAFLETPNPFCTITSIEQPFSIDSDTLSRTWEIVFKPADQTRELIEHLKKFKAIELVERVPLTRIFLTPNDPLYSTTTYGYDWSWHLDNIQAESAWDLSTGSSSVKVAIVDNAVYTSHPDLQNKIVTQRDVSNNDNNASPPSTGSTYDKYIWSHGTHCAGLVGAETNNGIGVAGIGYNISLMGVKAAPDSSSGEYTYNGIEGVQWAAQNGADIISVSWGGTGYSAVNNNFYNTLKNNGIFVVAAAGNEGDAGNPKLYPAGYSSVIAVGSTNADDIRSSFSQYGDWLDVSAPGGYYPEENTSYKISVLSTTFNNAYIAQGAISGPYDLSQGTSMSTPIVAGLLGLMKSVAPGAPYNTMKNCLIWGADNIDGLNSAFYAGKMGAGRINALKSMQCITGTGMDTAEDMQITLFPNPSKGTFVVRNLNSHNFDIQIFDIKGELLYQQHYTDNFINLSHLSSGMYILKIKTAHHHIVRKIILNPE